MGLDPISSIIASATTILGKFFPDATDEMKAKFGLVTQQLQIEAQAAISQMDINKAEAQNPHIFVAGARPAAMWVCVLGLLYTVGYPLISWFVGMFSAHIPPALDTAYLQYLLGALLGLGGMHSFDKVKGVATKGVSF